LVIEYNKKYNAANCTLEMIIVFTAFLRLEENKKSCFTPEAALIKGNKKEF